MAENKTRPSNASVIDYIDALESEARKADSKILLQAMTEWTGMQPRLWGSSIIGFGEYHYKYESGREGDHLLIDFAPRMTRPISSGLKRFH